MNQTTLEVVDDGYFWRFRLLLFENFRDTAGNNM